MPRKKERRDVPRARTLRREMSLPEVQLWQLLKGSPNNVRFRRQHPIGDYVLDFYVAERKTTVEIDGISHDMGDRPLRDATRDDFLKAVGVRVIRVSALEVLRTPEAVAEMLVEYCSTT